jgi:hypothetical protein
MPEEHQQYHRCSTTFRRNVISLHLLCAVSTEASCNHGSVLHGFIILSNRSRRVEKLRVLFSFTLLQHMKTFALNMSQILFFWELTEFRTFPFPSVDINKMTVGWSWRCSNTIQNYCNMELGPSYEAISWSVAEGFTNNLCNPSRVKLIYYILVHT